MKSRVAITIDDDNQPIIKIHWRESEDARDILVKRFLETFGGDSSLAQFLYLSGPQDGEAQAKLRPIVPDVYNEIVNP